ncbi:MAG: DNA polymerase III subunit delta' [Deltaproteobacteria bacterium]|nr:DNA polymerase III subunit delta' [Deltaproteobacteria bacterium]
MRFSDIKGHARELALLKRAASSGRLAHAYLFAGQRGVGKVSTALAFAAALNCEKNLGASEELTPETAEERGTSCGTCKTCVSITARTHPNLILLEPDEKGSLKIDRVRDLQKSLNFRVEKGTRVAVIDSAEAMVRNASSVLLKTLEEPPAGSILILTTAKPNELLRTILSRCQRLNFRPLSQILVKTLINESHGSSFNETEAEIAARLSFGSIGSALNILDFGLIEKSREFLKAINAISAGNPEGLFKVVSAFAKDEDLPELLGYLQVSLRDMALRLEGAKELTVTEPGEGLVLKKGARGGIKEVLGLYAVVEEVRKSIASPSNGNKVLALESLFFSIKMGTRPSNLNAFI